MPSPRRSHAGGFPAEAARMSTDDLFAWGDQFVLGVDSMDDQHRGLIEAMNELHRHHREGTTGSVTLATLAKLDRLTRSHFADEEAFMEATGFADLETHRLIHAKLLEQLSEQAAAVQSADGAMSDELFWFLKRWLGAHIQGIDRKYALAAQPS